MASKGVIAVDLVDVWAAPGRKRLRRTLAWGDEVTVSARTATHIEIETVHFNEQPDGSILPVKEKGYIEPRKSARIDLATLIRPVRRNDVLKVNCVDVQQGDGAVIEAPNGKVILVDGGDNQLFARYLAGRFRGTTAAKPRRIDCLLVTHGDADHFAGLREILDSETNREKRKRLFMQPRRYYHNGLVKRPATRDGKRVSDVDLLGPTTRVGKQTWLTGLVDNLLDVPDSEMNQPFLAWKKALATYHARAPVECRRLQFGDDDAFSFFNKGDLKIEVLGPLTSTIDGKPALRFLGDPPHGPRVGHESLATEIEDFGGHSASHTINGHSIVFRLRYGGFSYLFTGDLNNQASRYLANEHRAGRLNLQSEIFKVPHHGSSDFSGALLQAVSPIVSIVSSGDEHARKEYIHPRATLMGALGRWSRVPEPLIFVTELVAFFKVEGWSTLAKPTSAEDRQRGEFFGFSRTAYGMVKTRTNGKRLLVYTDSGNFQMKEAYAYSLDADGIPQPSPVLRV